MLEREELLKFEQQLLKLSKEDEQYSSDSPFVSILDQDLHVKKEREDLEDLLGASVTQQTKEKSIFEEDIEDVEDIESLIPQLDTVETEEGAEVQQQDTEAASPQAAPEPADSPPAADASLSSDGEEERGAASEPPEAPEAPEPPKSADAPEAPERSPAPEISATPASPEAQEAEETEAVSDVEEESLEAVEEDEQIAELYSGIEEEEEEGQEEFTGFFLPQSYKTLGGQEESSGLLGIQPRDAEKQSAQEAELRQGISEIEEFDLDEYERSIKTWDAEYDESMLDAIIEEQSQAESEEDKSEKVVQSSFNEEDEVLFFENLKTYSIFIQRAVIEIINSENEEAAAMVLDAVLSLVPPTLLRKTCEKLLDYDLPDHADATIYTSNELEQKLSTLAGSFLKVSHRLFIDVLPKVGAVLLLLLCGYVWVLQPFRAWQKYEQGYELLAQQDYEQSELLFREAGSIRYMQRYYFRYADEYFQQKSYLNVETKYKQLLFGLNDDLREYLERQVRAKDYFFSASIAGRQRFLFDTVNFKREGFSRLISFVKEQRGDLQFALALYDLWLSYDNEDLEFMLGKAGIYIDLYDKTLSMQYLDTAKEEYDRVMLNSEHAIESVLARLRWAVRAETDEAKKYVQETVVYNQLPYFLEYDAAWYPAYTEVAAYLLQTGEAGASMQVLDILQEAHPEDALVSFLRAKAHVSTQDYANALLGFDTSLKQYAQKERLETEDFLYITESKILQAEIVQEQMDDVVQAEGLLYEAQQLYEQKLSKIRAERKKNLAELYYLQSKILLERRELKTALQYVLKAQQEQYDSLPLQYHYGLLQYLQEEWSEAGKTFLTLLPQFPENTKNRKELLYSTANTQYLRGNYAGAVAYYEKALTEQNKYFQGGEGTLQLINTELDSYVAEAVDTLAYIKNNLGVSYYSLYQQYPYQGEYLSAALRYLREANTILENRNRTNAIRKGYQELPALNLAVVFGVADSYPPQIFDVIARELPETYAWDSILINADDALVGYLTE